MGESWSINLRSTELPQRSHQFDLLRLPLIGNLLRWRYYLALGLSNWAIARKCSLSLRGVESRLATLYEKLFVSVAEGTDQEAYEKLAYNIRTRAFFEALRRGLLNSDELEKASNDLEAWLQKDQKRFNEEQKLASKKK